MIPDHDTVGLYSLVEVPRDKVLELQRDLGKDWKDYVWIYGQETPGLTKEQVGQIIASRMPTPGSNR